MKYRMLRITWSVFWGIVAMLLVALCVRSYLIDDVVIAPGDGSRRLGSGKGWITIRWMEPRPIPKLKFKTWHLVSLSVDDLARRQANLHIKTRPPRFGLIDSGAVQFPYWLATALCAGMSLAYWQPKIVARFSLRSLLIITTLVAMVLGLIGWARQ